MALGGSNLLLPLIGLDAGYSAAQIGVLTACSALAQILIRLTLGVAMRLFPDRALITTSGVLLAGSFVCIAASSALAPFVLAEILQGASRACFWTGLQTHVVRGESAVVGNLARVNLVGNVGNFIGPIGAGFLAEFSVPVVLYVGATVAGASALLSLFMQRLPPFQPTDRTTVGRPSRQPGVLDACMAVAVSGAWRGLVGSYFPVVLESAGHTAAVIGVLVALANGASTASAAGLAGAPVRSARPALVAASLATALGTVFTGLFAGVVLVAAGCLVLGGLGSGVLQIMGSAVAAAAVHPQQRGEAIAMTGTWRAVAMFVSPLTVAAILPLVGIASALAVIGVALGVPALRARRLVDPFAPAPP